MAIPNSPQDFLIGFTEQTTFGTAIVDTVAADVLVCDAVQIPNAVNYREGSGHGGARYLFEDDISVDQNGVLTEFTVVGTAHKLTLPYLLYLFFQNVSEGTTPTYAKTFTLGTTQPDFASDAGLFLTVWAKSPTASTSSKVHDCICKGLRLECQPSGVLKYSADLVAPHAAEITANPTGAWTRNPSDEWDYNHQVRHTADFGSGAVTLSLVGGWTLEFTQNVQGVGQDGAGGFEDFLIDTRRIKFSSNIRWDANAQSCQADLITGASIDFNIGWGNASAGTVDGDLDFTSNAILSEANRNAESPTGVNIVANCVGASGVQPMTAIIADSDLKSW